MKWTLVRYRAKPDRADENQRLSAAVFDELQDKAPAGLRYAVFRLPDDTFVHLASLEDGGTPLSSLESFRALQKDIRERCAEGPQPVEPRLVGNYGMLSQKALKESAMQHDIVSRKEWLTARTNLLAAEKRLTEARAAVQAERRKMPWTRVDKNYVFDTPSGRQSLTELFEGRGRLLVYHFMFAPEWQDGCPGCSQGADHFDGMEGHLPRLNATFTAVSRAPIAKIEDYRKRKGWRFKWVSAAPSDFNYDYQVSFPPQTVEKGEGIYGYEFTKIDRADLPGTSVFARNEAGEVFHVYSAYTNGGDMPLAAHYPELLR